MTWQPGSWQNGALAPNSWSEESSFVADGFDSTVNQFLVVPGAKGLTQVTYRLPNGEIINYPPITALDHNRALLSGSDGLSLTLRLT